jgi:hypothetical protein
MNISNMKLSSIEARRYSEPQQRPQNVRIDHNSTVTLFSASGDTDASIEFQYTASYGPLGLIKLSGDFHLSADNAREIAEQWSQDKNMPEEVASRIHTAIMHFCLPEAVMVSRDLRLPPPIPMPQVKFDKDQGAQQQGKGGFSPEVA